MIGSDANIRVTQIRQSKRENNWYLMVLLALVSVILLGILA